MNHEKEKATGVSQSDREQMRLLAKNPCPEKISNPDRVASQLESAPLRSCSLRSQAHKGDVEGESLHGWMDGWMSGHPIRTPKALARFERARRSNRKRDARALQARGR
jgi:hypothetical protein